MIFQLVNWYVKRFSFPRRGLKYFIRFLKLTRNYNRTYVKKLHNNYFVRVNPADHIQRQIFWYGYYEPKYILTWESFVERNHIVFDIGANIGYYSIIASSKLAQGCIYAFEPYQKHYNELLANLRLNEIDNVEALNLAVSDHQQETQLFISSADNSGMSGLTQPENFSGQTEKIVAISIDELIKEGKLPKPDVIKMDIEGAEWMALHGMQMALKNEKPVTFIEIASSLLLKYGKRPADIYRFMNEQGYKPYQVIEQNKLKPLKDYPDDELIVFIPDSYKIPTAIEIV